jgi:hypothetical protein
MLDVTATLPPFVLVSAECGGANQSTAFVRGDVVLGTVAVALLNFSAPVAAVTSAVMFGRNASVEVIDSASIRVSALTEAPDWHAAVSVDVAAVSHDGIALVLTAVHDASVRATVGADNAGAAGLRASRIACTLMCVCIDAQWPLSRWRGCRRITLRISWTTT